MIKSVGDKYEII